MKVYKQVDITVSHVGESYMCINSIIHQRYTSHVDAGNSYSRTTSIPPLKEGTFKSPYIQVSSFLASRDAMTRNQIILTKQSGRVTKILTDSRILQISIALCQIKAKIHSFPTMYIIGGGKFGLTK